MPADLFAAPPDAAPRGGRVDARDLRAAKFGKRDLERDRMNVEPTLAVEGLCRCVAVAVSAEGEVEVENRLNIRIESVVPLAGENAVVAG